MILKPFSQTAVCLIIVDSLATLTNSKRPDTRVKWHTWDEICAAAFVSVSLTVLTLCVGMISASVPQSRVLHGLDTFISVFNYIAFVWFWWYLLYRVGRLWFSLNAKPSSLFATVLLGVLLGLIDWYLAGVPQSFHYYGPGEGNIIDIVGYLLATWLPTYSVWEARK